MDKEHEAFLNDLKGDLEQGVGDEDHIVKDVEEDSKLRKVFLFGSTAFLIILFLSLYLMNPGAQTMISKIGSYLASDDVVRIDAERTMQFTGDTFAELKGLYLDDYLPEIKVCLMGRIENGNLIITRLHKPNIYYQEFDKVSSSPCPDETLVSMHSHPMQHCAASAQDLRSHAANKLRNPRMLMAIMCEVDRFRFYE